MYRFYKVIDGVKRSPDEINALDDDRFIEITHEEWVEMGADPFEKGKSTFTQPTGPAQILNDEWIVNLMKTAIDD